VALNGLFNSQVTRLIDSLVKRQKLNLCLLSRYNNDRHNVGSMQLGITKHCISFHDRFLFTMHDVSRELTIGIKIDFLITDVVIQLSYA